MTLGLTRSDANVVTIEPAPGPRKRPLLFVHGIYHGGWCFLETFAPYFAALGHPCHVLTLRGHDARNGFKIRATRADYLDDVRAALNEIEPTPIVIGHSLGGMLVQMLVAEGTVRDAVLLATPTPLALLRRAVMETLRRPSVFLPAWLTFDMQRAYHAPEVCRDSFFSPGFPRDALERVLEKLRGVAYASTALLRTLFAPIPGPRPGFDGRVLVVGGALDPTCTPSVEAGIARRYGTRAVIVEGVSHDLMLDTLWRDAAAAVGAWLADGPDAR